MPPVDSKVFPQALHILNGGLSGVVREFRIRRRLTAPSLAELDDVESGRVEVLPVGRLSPAPRPAVNHQHGDAVRIAALFPSDGVEVRNR